MHERGLRLWVVHTVVISHVLVSHLRNMDEFIVLVQFYTERKRPRHLVYSYYADETWSEYSNENVIG